MCGLYLVRYRDERAELVLLRILAKVGILNNLTKSLLQASKSYPWIKGTDSNRFVAYSLAA
jgi:hypothetical protein